MVLPQQPLYRRHSSLLILSSRLFIASKTGEGVHADCWTPSLRLRLRLLLYKRYAALDEVGEVLALEHTVREQCKVDNLAHLAVAIANLYK